MSFFPVTAAAAGALALVAANVVSPARAASSGEVVAPVASNAKGSFNDAKFATIAIDENFNIVSTYNMAVTKTAKNSEMAKDLVDLVSGTQGQPVLRKFSYYFVIKRGPKNRPLIWRAGAGGAMR